MRFKPRTPLTQQELNQLISSVQLRSRPADPCAKYQEVEKMKAQYRIQYGEAQLYKDYKLAQQRLGKE